MGNGTIATSDRARIWPSSVLDWFGRGSICYSDIDGRGGCGAIFTLGSALEDWISIAKCAVLTSLLLTLVGCGSRQPEPIYRYINLMDGSKIQLGEHFGREDLATPMNDTTYRFRPGTFAGGGTVVITAHTDTAGILRVLEFTYDGSESFEAKVRDYTRTLGPPKDSSAATAGGAIVVWEDSLTRFELHLVPGEQRWFWSRLMDRAVIARGAVYRGLTAVGRGTSRNSVHLCGPCG